MMSVFFSSAARAIALIVTGTATAVTAWSAAGAPLPRWLPVSVVVEQGGELAALIAELGAPLARDRALAACRIGRMRGRDVSAAGEPLLALLGDGTPVERNLCRERGNWVGNRDENSSPGREAAIALERVGDLAVDPLIGILRGDDAVARENAAMALGLIEQSRAIAPLVAALDDEIEAVRARSAWALGMIEDSAAVGTLGEALADGSARVRSQAAWALGMIEASSAVPGLIGALRDEDARVREQAAWALGMIEDGAAVDALLDALEDEDNAVRKQAIWALMRCIDHDDVDHEELAAKLRRALIGGGGASTPGVSR